MSTEIRVLDFVDKIDKMKSKGYNIYLNKYKTEKNKVTFSYFDDNGLLHNLSIILFVNDDDYGLDMFIRVKQDSLPYPEDYKDIKSDEGFELVDLHVESNSNGAVKLLNGEDVVSIIELSASEYSDDMSIRNKYIDTKFNTFLTKNEKDAIKKRNLIVFLMFLFGFSTVLLFLIILSV